MGAPRQLGLLPLALLAGCLAQPFDVPTEPLSADEVVVASADLQVLPFSVRMEKLAHVLQVPVNDPLFATLRDQRFALGDHDYARALRPDRRWSARKLTLWVKGLLPVCRSARFAALYPAAADQPDALILRAWGRPADADDLAHLAELRASADGVLDRHQAACVAVLSALELVAR